MDDCLSYICMYACLTEGALYNAVNWLALIACKECGSLVMK